jgi:hypothetical protein
MQHFFISVNPLFRFLPYRLFPDTASEDISVALLASHPTSFYPSVSTGGES